MSAEKILCPQCGRELDADAKQCFVCGCYLKNVDEKEKEELKLQQEEFKKEKVKETETVEAISGEKVGSFLLEDVKRFWNGFWGDKMPKKFIKMENRKLTFSFSGAVLPSVWLAFRKKPAMAALVMLINYGLPFSITRFAYQMFSGVDEQKLKFFTDAANMTSLGLAVVFGFFLPAYFYSETKKSLEALGCKDRAAFSNKELDKKINEAGRPSFILAILAGLVLIIFSGVILGPTIPPVA